jgi:urea transport system substrate-binding protein
VILNCVVGGSNVAFFKQLTAAGINGSNQTVLSLAVSEEEVSGIGSENTAGTLTCMGYFQSLKNPANEKFVKAFKAKYGQNRVVGDTLECGYISVYLWKLAAEKAKSFDVEKVVAASSDCQSMLRSKVHFARQPSRSTPASAFHRTAR